jgi:hypothetical protein
MNSPGKIISLSSRRPTDPFEEQVTTRAHRRGGLVVGLSLVGALVLFVAGAVVGQTRAIDRLEQLPAGVRTGLYQRGLADLKETCTRPEAAEDGLLHQHCLDEAAFLAVFSECDRDCRSLVTAVLPHARR